MGSITSDRPWRRACGHLLAVALCLVVQVSLLSLPASAAGATLTAAPARAIAGERVVLSGKLASKVARRIVLQRKQGSRWVSDATGRTSAAGSFRFVTRARPSTTTFRVSAARTTVRGKKYAAARTPARTITTQVQSARLGLPATATLDEAAAATATFSPARPGRPVQLQRSSGGRWVVEATASQGAGGAATLPVDTSSTGTFAMRVVTLAAGGAAPVASPTRSITIASPDNTPPSPVTGVTADEVTATSVSLSWVDPDDEDFRGVMVRRAVGSVAPSTPTAGELVAADAFGGLFDSGLAGGTTYSYGLFAHDDVPNYAAPASLTVTTPTPDTTPPAPVTNPTAQDITVTSATLAWTNPDDPDLASVVIRRAVGTTPPATPDSGVGVARVGPDQASWTDEGLAGATTYSYSFFAVDDEDNHAAPATTTFTTPTPDTTPPGPVTGVTVDAVTSTSVSLRWTNPTAPDFAGVVVRRAVGSTPPSSDAEGTLVVAADPTDTTYTDTGLAAGTQYAYAFFARDDVPNYATAATVVTRTEAADTQPPGRVSGVTSTTTPTSVTLAWTNPPESDVEGVMVRRATGPVPPSSPTSGTLVGQQPAPTATLTDDGLAPGTQYSYALFAFDEVPNYGPATGITVTTAAPTTADWAQTGHDAGHTGWAREEQVISAATAGAVAEEFSIPGQGSPAIAGGLLYVAGQNELAQTTLSAYDLQTAAPAWQLTTQGACGGPLAVTAELVIASCGGAPRAYQRFGTHAVVWDVADTDPGQSLQRHQVIGTTLLAWTSTRVAAYRLSDGQRLWQQVLPSGAGSIYDVAAAGDTVVVAYDDRVRALSLSTGSQRWTRADLTTGALVVADEWVYLNHDGAARQVALTTGTDGWTAMAGESVYRVVAADDDTVYVWRAEFDFGPPSPSVLHALRASDGGQRWSSPVPSRIGSVAVTGGLVWLTSTGIYSQERSSDLIALKRSDGSELKRIGYDDNMYGWSDVAFGGGKVVIDQGGSFGAPTTRRLRVLGLGGEVPVITSEVLPLAYVGSSYQRQLSATGAGSGATWGVERGTLPAGVTLSASGRLLGTPTAAGTSRVRVRVQAPNGRSAERWLVLQVIAPSTPGWSSYARDATRNAFEASVAPIDAETAASIGFRWRTGPRGEPATSFHDPITVGDRLYDVGADGALRAYDATGTTPNRAPLWTATPAPVDGATPAFAKTPTLAGDRLVVTDSTGRLSAVRATDGTTAWRTAAPVGPASTRDVLVVGSTILVLTQQGGLTAYSLTDGTPLWGGLETEGAGDFEVTALSSDGTRVFATTRCELYAVVVATGAVAWHTPVSGTGSTDCRSYVDVAPAPVVLDGVVYASTPWGLLQADAATGAPLLRVDVRPRGAQVVVGGVWMFTYNERLFGIDTTSGEVLWSTGAVAYLSGVAVSRDLVVVQGAYGEIFGLDRLTGEQIWDGGSSGRYTGQVSPAVGANRIFVSTFEGVSAHGPL